VILFLSVCPTVCLSVCLYFFLAGRLTKKTKQILTEFHVNLKEERRKLKKQTKSSKREPVVVFAPWMIVHVRRCF